MDKLLLRLSISLRPSMSLRLAATNLVQFVMYLRYEYPSRYVQDVKSWKLTDLFKSQVPQTPHRSLRPRAPTTPKLYKQKSPEKRTSPEKNKSAKKAKSPQKRRVAATEAPQSTFYSIRGILNENETDYLVDWEDIGSQSFSPTWEPKGNVTDLAVQVWEEEKKKIEKR